MNKIFNSVIIFVLTFSCMIMFTACGGDVWEPPHNVVQNLPDKIHVEYASDDYYTTIFIKDGNEYYCKGKNIHGYDRDEIYMRRDLSHEVCVAEGYGGWGFITARWNSYSEPETWLLAADDLGTSPNEPAWHANDKNQNTYTNAEYKTRHGYSDVNSALLDGETHKVTKLENQTITVGENQVECVVWVYEFDYDGTYSKSKYWFAADTGVYLKGLSVYDREANIDTDGSTYGHPIATYYKVGDSMDTALATISAKYYSDTVARTKYVFPPEYV